nr:hypothetical protein CFP56_27223 [Quercus suber]
MNLLPWELLCPVQMIERENKNLTIIITKTKTSNWLLLEKGNSIVVLTLGSASDGVFLCAKGGSSFMRFGLQRIKPCGPSSVVTMRLTGASDCLVGGKLASICAGLNFMQSVAFGIAAARAAVEAETYCI